MQVSEVVSGRALTPPGPQRGPSLARKGMTCYASSSAVSHSPYDQVGSMNYTQVVGEQWLLIAATVLVASTVAAVVTLLTPRLFRSSARIFVSMQIGASNSFAGGQYAQYAGHFASEGPSE